MVQVTIDISQETNRKIKEWMIKENVTNKPVAIVMLLERVFNNTKEDGGL